MNIYKIFFKPFIPRIFLDQTILLAPAQILLIHKTNDYREFKDYLQSKLSKYNLFKKVVINDVKGGLVVDTEIDSHVQLLFKKLKEIRYLYVSECLYDSYLPCVTDVTHNFAHELIVSVKNTSFDIIEKNYSDLQIEQIKSGHIPFINDWLYLELYCSSYATIDILKYINDFILVERAVKQFFFVRYNTIDNHLRVRFKIKSASGKKFIIQSLAKLKHNCTISKYIILPYAPEVERYGGYDLLRVAEQLFDLDSRNVIKDIINQNLTQIEAQLLSILKIKFFLELIDFDIEQMLFICETNILSFSKEFNLDRQTRNLFNKEYKSNISKLNNFKCSDFIITSKLKNTLHKNLKKNKISKINYVSLLIHMSMNRHFIEDQRFNELKSYYVTKLYLNQLKFKATTQ